MQEATKKQATHTTVAIPAKLMPAIEAKKAEAIESLGVNLTTSQIVHAMILKGLKV